MSDQASVDPWVVQEAKQFVPLPIGFYTGVFKGVKDVVMKDGKLKWRFEWEVKTGPEAGKLATALTDQRINADTLPGRLISGLLGRAVVNGEGVKASVDACLGKVFIVGVQPGPKGGKPQVQTCGLPPATM